MKKFILGAAMAAALAVPASAGSYSKTIYQFSNDVIIVSCFRGPWKDVIWDRPNSNFIDSLIKIGYDYPTSHAIAERVCRAITARGMVPSTIVGRIRWLTADANAPF